MNNSQHNQSQVQPTQRIERPMFAPQQQNKLLDQSMYTMRRSNINTSTEYYSTQNPSLALNQPIMPQNFTSVTPRNSQKSIDNTIFQINQKLQRIGKLVEKHEQRLSNFSEQVKNQQIFQSILQKLQNSNTFKKIVSNSTSQLHEYIFSFKIDIKALKDQLSQCIKKQELSTQLLRIQGFQSLQSPNKSIKRSLSSSPQKGNNPNPINMQIFQEIQNKFFKSNEQAALRMSKLEKQLVLVQKNMQKYINEVEVKAGPMKSVVSPIIVDYKQFFIVNVNGKEKLQIPISKTTYFIDKQGYLLDGDNRYLLRQNGKRIQLQQKHRELLKKSNMLFSGPF